jgi:hypothetical protein
MDANMRSRQGLQRQFLINFKTVLRMLSPLPGAVSMRLRPYECEPVIHRNLEYCMEEIFLEEIKA